MANQKRKISPQTRVKESQSSKKRQRSLKGTKQGGQFLKGRQALHTIFQGAAHPARDKQLQWHMPNPQEKSYEFDEKDEIRDVENWGKTQGGGYGGVDVGNELGAVVPVARKIGGGAANRSPQSLKADLHDYYKENLNSVVRDTGLSPTDPGIMEVALKQTVKDVNSLHNFSADRGTSVDLRQAREMLGFEGRSSTMRKNEVLGRGVQSVPLSSKHRGSKLEFTDSTQETDVVDAKGKPGGHEVKGRRYQPGSTRTTGSWREQRGSLAGSGRPADFGPGHPDTVVAQHTPEVAKGKEPPSQALNRMTPEEKQWITSQINREGSPFYGASGTDTQPGAYRRLRQYTDMRQHGFAAGESYDYVSQGGGNARKGPQKKKTPATSKPAPGQGGKTMEDMAKGRIQQRTKPKAQGKKKKEGKSVQSHQSFGVGIQIPGIDKLDDLKKQFPDWSDADLLRYQLEQGEAVNEYALANNERWAHEQKAARLLEHQTNNVETGDRVTVFTTNLGAPAVSVPANSMMGQYVIKKRKKMLVDNGYKRWEVKGEYPRAVRDMHVMELSTGYSLGLQGRYGVFHNTGWRKGSKTSKGFSNNIPVGTQVLRNSAGEPIYDKQGNQRYTEGYSREISGATKDVGLRVFIG